MKARTFRHMPKSGLNAHWSLSWLRRHATIGAARKKSHRSPKSGADERSVRVRVNSRAKSNEATHTQKIWAKSQCRVNLCVDAVDAHKQTVDWKDCFRVPIKSHSNLRQIRCDIHAFASHFYSRLNAIYGPIRTWACFHTMLQPERDYGRKKISVVHSRDTCCQSNAQNNDFSATELSVYLNPSDSTIG